MIIFDSGIDVISLTKHEVVSRMPVRDIVEVTPAYDTNAEHTTMEASTSFHETWTLSFSLLTVDADPQAAQDHVF